MFKRFAIIAPMAVVAGMASAQVTSSSVVGRITDQNGEAVIGANIVAVHTPSGTRYGGMTNNNGSFNLNGLRSGGPYDITISYIGYKSKTYKNVVLQLGSPLTIETSMEVSSTDLDEAVIVATGGRSNMSMSRSGAITTVDAERMSLVPTASRDLTSMLIQSPQGSTAAGGYAVGGGNYRQSNITIDGAQFNNAFGLGSNILPGGGTPISLDAIEQVSVSITPYDVRQSGFNGAAINAVTKSGTNDFHATAYSYLTGNKLRGEKICDDKLDLDDAYKRTLGASFGGRIIKDKLFFFINGEYEWNSVASPTAKAGGGENGKYTNTNRRPTLDQLNGLSDYLAKNYGYTTGPWQDYGLSAPAWRIMARVDWNINDANKLNVRFTKSGRKSSSAASSSRTIGVNQSNNIYNGSNSTYGSGSYYGMSSLSSRYYSNFDFTSVAGELNSRLTKRVQNTLRATYSFQDQPRSTEYGDQPIIEVVMNDGQGHYPTWALTGDVFTQGNLSQTKTLVVTDEVNMNFGKHNIIAGMQYEMNKAANGFAQAAGGYYAYEATPEQVAAGDWGSVFGAAPRVFGMTYGNGEDHSMFTANMTTHQLSWYAQDNFDISNRFKLSFGLRVELPFYPSLDNNFNQEYYDNFNYALAAAPANPGTNVVVGERRFRTDNVPDANPTFSPRVGFNWDVIGDRKIVLRGGTGLFVGRMPYVWLVSAVGNSGMGQTSKVLTGDDCQGVQFVTSQAELLQQIKATSSTSVPTGATILSDDLKMPTTWKASLAADFKLPGDVDFSLEGIYNKDLNPCIITNANVYWDGTSTVMLSPGDVRHQMSSYFVDSKGKPSNQAYVIENAGRKAYYYSITASLHKRFNCGFDLSASYTHSLAKSYSEGIGDQVSSAYTNYRNSVNGVNDHELGYATYVQPNRVLATASYILKEGNFGQTTFSLQYEGGEAGYLGSYSYTRYSYIYSKNINNDASAPGNLIYVPASREELDSWNFKDNGTYTDRNGEKHVYTADNQRDDFWTYIQQNDYLKSRKGKYAERGGAKMPWHHQLNLKFAQDFNLNRKGGMKHVLTVGMDVNNLLNALDPCWGTYKQVVGNTLLTATTAKDPSQPATFTYNLMNGARHTSTTQDYLSTASTWNILFNLRYSF